MPLSETLRRKYLDAMGITVWQSRFNSVISTPVEHVVVPSAPVEKTSFEMWESLHNAISHCKLCNLCTTRTQTVFGEGDVNAKWLWIGEAPGQYEDEQGKPFIGESGELLTKMLKTISLTRDEIFITNILKCRPPENRDPHINEIVSCRPYLQHQIALIQPKIIITVGRIATQTLLETTEKMGNLRGQVHTYENIPLIAIYHPSYLLRSPLEKRKVWQDLQLALRTFTAF